MFYCISKSFIFNHLLKKKYCLWFLWRWVKVPVSKAPVTGKNDGKRQTGGIFTGMGGATTESRAAVTWWFSPQRPGSAAASVREALAGFLPATGGAPALPVLHPINLATLFGLATRPPAEHMQPWPNTISTLDQRLLYSPAGGAVLLQPLLADAHGANATRRTLRKRRGDDEGWSRKEHEERLKAALLLFFMFKKRNVQWKLRLINHIKI